MKKKEKIKLITILIINLIGILCLMILMLYNILEDKNLVFDNFREIVFFSMPYLSIEFVWIGGTYFYLVSYLKQTTQKPIKQLAKQLRFINSNEYNLFIDYKNEDDLKPLVDYVNIIGGNLSQQIKTLAVEKKKSDYIFENIDSGLILIDNNKSVVEINSKAKAFFKIDNDLDDNNIENICKIKAIISGVEKAINKGTSSFFDIDLRNDVGIIVAVKINSIDVSLSKEGRYAVVMITDITQTKQLELLRSEFVANASHELKTPITSIKGFSEILNSGMVKEESRKIDYINRINTESDRMANIIEDILKIAKLENPIETEEYTLVDVKNIFLDLNQLFEPTLLQKNIDVVMEGKLQYNCIYDDMQQLIKNLFENAIKYNKHDGKVKINMYTGNNKSVISISDTGIGIPKEAQNRIFERFYRVDKGRSREQGGTGLGLAIVKHIVSKYNGKLTLTSEINIGTEIKIILPIQ